MKRRISAARVPAAGRRVAGRKVFPRSMGIRLKLVLLFMALISFVTGVVSFINLLFSNRESAAQAEYSSNQALSQAASFLGNKCSSVIDILDIMAADETIRDLIDEPLAGYAQNLVKWWADARKLNTVLFNMRSNRDISSLHLYFAGGLSQVSGNSDFTGLDDVRGESWYDGLTRSPSRYRWFPAGSFTTPDSSGFVTAARKMPSADNLREVIGIVRADIPVSLLKDILNQGQYTPTAVLTLTNAEGALISASGDGQAGGPDIVRRLIAEAERNGLREGACQRLSVDGIEYLAGIQTIHRSDWTLTILTPYRDVLALGTRTQKRILLMFLLMAPLSLPLAFLAAQSFTNRIRSLAGRMRTIGAHHSAAEGGRRRNGRGDEIDELEDDYEAMLERLDALMSEMYDMGVANKNLELKALQSQINPHFLNNTLDLINMMGLKHNRPEIVSLVKALASFYRLSLGKGEDVVTVGKELDLVRAYIQIQNMRFDDCVALSVDVPEALLAVRMPKIILQPLVENAILHGILESDRETGSIRITGSRHGERVVLSIRDDGQGMEADVVRRLVARPALLTEASPVSPAAQPAAAVTAAPEADRTEGAPLSAGGTASPGDASGYGVRNIDQRLKLLFGPEFGLAVESAPGKGTTVHVVLRSGTGQG